MFTLTAGADPGLRGREVERGPHGEFSAGTETVRGAGASTSSRPAFVGHRGRWRRREGMELATDELVLECVVVVFGAGVTHSPH